MNATEGFTGEFESPAKASLVRNVTLTLPCGDSPRVRIFSSPDARPFNAGKGKKLSAALNILEMGR